MRLASELERLKKMFGMGQELTLEWLPGHVKHSKGRRLSGEAILRTIFVYEESEAKALDTLRHEFVENALVAELVRPYQKLVNKLIEMFEEDSYKRRDDLIERLCDVMNFEGDGHDAHR